MRLKSLKNQDPKVVEGILASLSLRLLPDPGINDVKPKSNFDDHLLDTVMEELRQILKLSPSDFSREALTKVYNFISSEMTEIAFANKDIDSIKNRIGEQGDLRPDLYKIVFAKSFDEVSKKLGIRRSHVESILRNPDSVEHLKPEESGLTSTTAASFYYKLIDNSKSPDKLSLIVITSRKGYTQTVLHAWKIFHNDIDMLGATSPVDIFKRFLDVYGLNVMFEDEVSKFIYFERKEIIKNKKNNELIKFENPGGDDVIQNIAYRISEDGKFLEIAMAFTVNFTKYSKDLLTHGIVV